MGSGCRWVAPRLGVTDSICLLSDTHLPQRFREVDLPRIEQARSAAAERRQREQEESAQRWREEWERIRGRFEQAPPPDTEPMLGPVEARMAKAEGKHGGEDDEAKSEGDIADDTAE